MTKRLTEAEEVRAASGTNNVPRMLRAVGLQPGNLVDRGYLLQGIVHETFRRRNRSRQMRRTCEEIARKHIAEYPRILKARLKDVREENKRIVEDHGRNPFTGEPVPVTGPPRLVDEACCYHAPTFRILATLLAEKADYAGAVRVCRRALSLGLTDGTKGGFAARIERIRAAKGRADEPDKRLRRRGQVPCGGATKGEDTKPLRSTVPVFKKYFPREENMSDRQRAFFDKWRTAWGRRKPIPVDGQISYLFCHTYSVLERGPSKAQPELHQLIRAYEESEPGFAGHCRSLLSDCHVVARRYRQALALYPVPEPDSKHLLHANRILSLKRATQARLCGSDLLALVGPEVTRWGRQNIDAVRMYLDTAISAYERNNRIDLVREWSQDCAQRPYTVFNGSFSVRRLRFKCFMFSERPGVCEFARQLVREAENTARDDAGLPKVGEGWIAETELLYRIRAGLAAQEVMHHARFDWLHRQHLDIYIPALRVALEYQGKQHDEPVAYFGGERAFLRTKQRDRRKRKVCEEHGIRVVYVRPGYELGAVLRQIANE